MEVERHVISFVDEVVDINRQEIEYKLKREIQRQLEEQKVGLRKEMEERLKLLSREESNNNSIITKADVFEDSPLQPQESTSFLKSANAFLGFDRYGALTGTNTETLSMFGVSEIVKQDGTIVRKILVSLLILTIVATQFFILDLTLLESSHPDCFSMVDCNMGTYCGFNKFPHPTCIDCRTIMDVFAKKEPALVDNECANYFPEGKWNDFDLADIDHNELLIRSETGLSYTEDNKRMHCLSFKHCQNSDIDNDSDVNSTASSFRGHCDFLYLNKKRFEKRSHILIFFLGLLWALPISMDIEEAALEEIVLDFHLNGSLNIPAEILRLALRLRRTAQPFMATTATLTLLITDEFSAKNAILNFLSITFITEADNVLAILFLRSHHKEQMDKVVDSVTFENVPHASTVFFWARVQGLICFVLLFTGLIIIDSQVLDCDNIYQWLIQYAAFSATALNCAQLFYVAFIMRCGRALLKQVFFALNEASRNIFVLCSAHLTTVGIAVVIEGYKYTLQPLVKVSFPAVFGVFFALESCRWWLWHRKCQNTDLPRTNQAGNV